MITGSLVALITPMHTDGSVDYDALSKLLNWHVEQKTDAIVILGTTGESPTLTASEKKRIIEHTISEIKGRLPVIVGTGTNATQTTLEATQQAKDAGADGCLIVAPYYNRPTQEGLFQHFKTAASVAIPQILYNHPGRTGIDIQADTVVRLAALPNIAGIKEVSGELDRCPYLREKCGDDFALYSGDDGTALDFILAGGNGVISVIANIAPKAMHDLTAAALSNDRETAEKLNQNLLALYDDLGVETNPIPVKWAAYHMGLVDSGIRLPLLPLSKTHHDTVAAHIKEAGLSAC